MSILTLIRKMVFTGFKSFGKRTELLFGDKYNVIAGPNGSGKSNVLDGLCFVLGKSSAKSMRAEKTSNLIYNGGKSKQPAKFAEVSIYFDNKKKTFPSETETVKITRIVRQSGQSIYKINDEVRTRQQILDLLSIANINPDGYNIVLQGDIVHIVEMSPVERRQIIEEIAGISQYEEKKQKALLELEKVEIKLTEAEIVLKERQAYLKELKKDRDQALKYQQLNNMLKQNKASFIKHQIDDKQIECSEWEKKYEAEKTKLTKVQEKIGKYKEEINQKKGEIDKILAEIESSGETEQIALQKQVESLRVVVATSQQRIQNCQTELSKIEQRKQTLQHSLNELDNTIKRSEGEIEELGRFKKSLQEERATLEKRLSELRTKHHLDDQAADIEKKIATIDLKIDDQQKIVSILREQEQNLLREKDKTEIHLQTVDDRIKKVETIETEHADQLRALKQKKEEFKKATLELNGILTQDSSMAANMSKMRQELSAARERLGKLEAKQIGIRENVHANIAIAKIVENKKEFPGVYGTVAELGEVKSAYALALETAAGPRMKSIVVKDDKVAADCIRYLKENKFGVASFLPLNKIRPADTEKKIDKFRNVKGVEGLAIDLVRFDPMFKTVFSYVFGATLVVDSIEIARKVGIGEVRMATLDGDLSETSGAMIGGFHVRKHGGFKEQELTNQLEEAGKDVIDLDVSIQRIENQRIANEEKITRLRELKANLEADIIKTEKSMHLDSTDLEASQAYKQELNETSKHITKQIDDIQDKIREVNTEFARFKIEKQQLRDAIMQLKNPAVLAELNAYDQKTKELTEKIIKTESDMKNAQLRVHEVYKKEQENTKKILKDLEREGEQFEVEGKQLQNSIKTHEKDLLVQEEKQKQFYARHKSLYDKRAHLQDQINKTDNECARVEEQSRQVEYVMNTMSLELAKHRAEKAGMEAEFEQYSGVELDMGKPLEILRKEIAEFEKMKENIGMVNMRSLELYDKVEAEYKGIIEKKETLHSEKQAVLDLMTEIEGKKKELFVKNYEVINEHFKRIFGMLTTKGSAAHLELENSEDPFAGGIVINVKITGDKFLDIRSLSGGEKTMTALAFLFAIQEHEPASFYILDEVDAALDTNNSSKLGKLIGKYCENAQYIVISHNDAVISESEFLYGVSMNQDGISSVVSLKV